MNYKPFTTAGVDALAQCPKCLRTWTYDSVDAFMDYKRQPIEGQRDNRYCPNCNVRAKFFQSLEQRV